MKLQQPEFALNAEKKVLFIIAERLSEEESSAIGSARSVSIDGSLWKNISETSIKRLDIQCRDDYD